MARLKFIDIMILLVIAATIALGIWMLFGSPTEMQAIITISVFFGSAGLMLWKYVFSIDKNTTIGFIKVKHEIRELKNNMNNRFNNIESKIDKLIKK